MPETGFFIDAPALDRDDIFDSLEIVDAEAMLKIDKPLARCVQPVGRDGIVASELMDAPGGDGRARLRISMAISEGRLPH